jgi:hypothetical protein
MSSEGVIRIRAATPGDAAAVAEMASALNVYEGKGPSPFTPEDFLRDGFGARAAFSTLVAERDGALVGYARRCRGGCTWRISSWSRPRGVRASAGPL